MAELFRLDCEGAAPPTAAIPANTGFTSVPGAAPPLFNATTLATGLAQSLRCTYSTQTGYGEKIVSAASTGYVRLYLRHATLPSGNIVGVAFRDSTAALRRAGIQLNTAGTVTLLNNTTGVATSSTVLTAGSTFRLEWDVVGATQTLRIYSGHSTSALETISGATPNLTWDQFRVGAQTNQTGDFYVDSIVLNSTNTPGAQGVAPSFTSGTSTSFITGTPGTFTVTTANGNPIPVISKTGSLPSGVTFTDNGDATATLAGTPAGGTAGSYPLTITATNATSAPTQSFTLTVTANTTVGPYAETLTAALNRCAGTTHLDACGAANVWAGTHGLDLVGALNAKNGSHGLGLARVLNQLAGTTSLDATGAADHLLA